MSALVVFGIVGQRTITPANRGGGSLPPAGPVARFWIYHNGCPVKVTMTPGQRLELADSWPSDEGYSCASTTWIHTGDRIDRFIESGGRDCDGVLMNYHDDSCPVHRLSVKHNPDNGLLWPEWGDSHTEVYDQFARAAGY